MQRGLISTRVEYNSTVILIFINLIKLVNEHNSIKKALKLLLRMRPSRISYSYVIKLYGQLREGHKQWGPSPPPTHTTAGKQII